MEMHEGEGVLVPSGDDAATGATSVTSVVSVEAIRGGKCDV